MQRHALQCVIFLRRKSGKNLFQQRLSGHLRERITEGMIEPITKELYANLLLILLGSKLSEPIPCTRTAMSRTTKQSDQQDTESD
ncbi:hypothetical protein ASD72_02525 [Pseudoxanthomonas sp. Root630]|nr:hypothetical protein ASD72_02525 [Pseudoxanthomonas sp. Root630]